MRGRSAFTVIEVLIITVIVALVSTGAVLSALKYRSAQDMRLSLDEFSALVRDVQRKSVTQEDGKRWGVRFENTESGKDRVYVFKGTSYASGTVTYSALVRRGVRFGDPGPSSTKDIVFTPIDGGLSPAKVVTLNTGLNDGLFGDIIVGALGRVSSRIDSGISGYWHFDEGTGSSTIDASGNGKSGTLSGLTWLPETSCKAGGCLNSSADSISVSGASPITGTSPFTISAWLNVDSHSNYGLAFYMGADAVGQLAWIGWTAGAQAGTSNSIGGGFFGTNYGSGITDTASWHHVAFTFAGGTNGAAKIYVDGVEKVSTTYTPNLSSAGMAFGHPSYPYNGDIDEVRLYNRELSATEILNIYNDLK